LSVDTLGYSKYLQEHGVSRADAEAHAEAIDRYLFPQLVTTADLKLTASELRLAISAVDGRLTALEARVTMLTWVVGLMFAFMLAGFGTTFTMLFQMQRQLSAIATQVGVAP
jgi:hypothetical protein